MEENVERNIFFLCNTKVGKQEQITGLDSWWNRFLTVTGILLQS